MSEISSASLTPSPVSPSFHLFAVLTSVCAFILVFVGALVTSTGSALAVPDWPLSFGKFFPPMTGGVLFEHGHRMIAGSVALMTWALGLWAYFSRLSKPVRLLSYLIASAILLQAILGGLTVLLLLPPSIAVFHALLGQTVFCLLLILADVSSPSSKSKIEVTTGVTPAQGGVQSGNFLDSGFRRNDESEQLQIESSKPGLWKYGAVAVTALYLQLLFGAILRHSGKYGFLHYAWSIGASISLITLFIAGLRSKIKSLKGLSIFAGIFVFFQVALGLLAYMRRISLDMQPGYNPGALLTSIHVALGALLLGSSVLWTFRAWQVR